MVERILGFFSRWVMERLQKRENRKSYIFNIYFRENCAGTKDIFSGKIARIYRYTGEYKFVQFYLNCTARY